MIDARTSPVENVARGWLGEPVPASTAGAEALRSRRPHRKNSAARSCDPGGIVVAHGYAPKLRVERRHLIVEDGFGRGRRTRRFHRTSRLRRLVVVGRSGYVTLDALRFLHDTGAAFVHVDANGELVVCSVPTGPDLAGLRRAQALAAGGPAGVEIARSVLTAKVEDQRAVLRELPADVTAVTGDGDESPHRSLDRLRVELDGAQTIGDMLAVEAPAAQVYWQAWSTLPVHFPRRDAVRLPEHWLTFGQRASLITGSPRTATNPANAILNYLYALLEAETILACHTVGLDPGLGIFHADRRDRASLALDLMEAARPAVDAYLLSMLTQRTLSAKEFVETREGGCRITPRFAAEITGTCDVWRSHVAPVVEQAAHTLARYATSPQPTSTPLTGGNRKRAWDQRARDRRQRLAADEFAKLPNTCRECGATLSDRRRRYCDEHRRERFLEQAPAGRQRAQDVLARLRAGQQDPAHGGKAATARGSKNAAHQTAVREWTGERPDPELFRAEILPELRARRISELVAATGLSEHYCSLIRLGKKVPHPRHWSALRAVGQSDGVSGRATITHDDPASSR